MEKQISTQLTTKYKSLHLQKNRYQSTNHTSVGTHQPLLLATAQPVDDQRMEMNICKKLVDLHETLVDHIPHVNYVMHFKNV